LERTQTGGRSQNGTGERKDDSPPKQVERFQEQRFTERLEQQQDEGIELTQGIGLEGIELAEFELTQLDACAIVFVSQAAVGRWFPSEVNRPLGE